MTAKETAVAVALVSLLAGAVPAIATGPSVGVPVASIGDVAVYDYAREATDSLASSNTGRVSGTFRAEVKGTTSVPDETGVPHEAMVVAWRREVPDPDHEHDAAFDLATRDLLAIRNSQQYRQGLPLGGDAATDVSMTSFAPGVDVWYHQWPDRAEARYQGRTFEADAPPADEILAPLRLDAEQDASWNLGRLLAFEGEVTTDVVDGELVVTTRTRSLMERTELGCCRARIDRVDVQTTRLDAASAWPTRVEWTVERTWTDVADGSVVRRVSISQTWDLAEVFRGSSPIPWRDLVPPSYRAADPALERAATPRGHPGDGARPRLAYPLEEAVAAVASDPTLARFAAWAAANPDHRVVGAASGSGTADRWVLLFAAPEKGDILAVETLRRDGVTVNRELYGQPTVRPLPEALRFRADDLPSSMISLAAAVDVHERSAGGGGPYAIEWGYSRLFSYAPQDVRGAWWDPASSQVFPDIVVAPPSSLFRSLSVRAAGASEEVLLDAVTGNLQTAVERETEIRWHGLSLPLSAPAPDGPSRFDAPRALPEAASAVVGALGALALVAYAWHLLKFAAAEALLAFPGYTRLKRATLLDNRVRDALAACIAANPGVSPPALQAAVGGAWSTIVYHLGVLEKNGLVHSLIDGRHRRFFPAGTIDRREVRALTALANPRTRAAYDHVRARPGIDRRTLARLLGVSLPGALWHLRRLADAELVDGRKEGRAVRFYGREPVVRVVHAEPTAP